MNIIFSDPIRLIFISIISSLILILFLAFYKFIFPKKNMHPMIIIILISILPIISIFRPGTYEAGDLSLHTFYLQAFYKNLIEGNFIPRWADDFCGGYGCAIFMFEYNLPFYIGSLFHFIGFSYLNSMKIFLAFSYIASGITMFIFLKDGYGQKAAVIGSLLYLFAPIRFMEMHFRVSVGTDAAFIFIPLAFLFAKKALNGNPKYIILYSLNFLLLILSHSSISLLTLPASIIYAFIKRKNNLQILFPMLAFILGIGLSAYYALPAFFEVKYSWYNSNLQSNVEFKPFLEYIYSPARFGLLFQGNHGELRLIIGYIHLLIVFFAAFFIIKKKIKKENLVVTIFLLIYFFTCFILMQSFTKPIWENIVFLQSFLLSWRMLIMLAFITSFLGAIIFANSNKKVIYVIVIITIFITILNWGNRRMVGFNPGLYKYTEVMYMEYFDENKKKYYDRAYSRIPNIHKLVKDRPKNHLEILSGYGQIKQINRSIINHKYIVKADTKIFLSENTYYFPGWNLYINGKKSAFDIQNPKKFGTITFKLPKGLYLVETKFEDTTIRVVGKIITYLTMIILLIYAYVYLKINKNMTSKL